MDFSKHKLNIAAIGAITGADTVSPAGALDFRMLANLQGGMAGGLTQRAGIGGGGGSGIPFSIQGTTSNPSFAADVGSVAGNVAKGAVQNAVFGKNKCHEGPWGPLREEEIEPGSEMVKRT